MKTFRIIVLSALSGALLFIGSVALAVHRQHADAIFVQVRCVRGRRGRARARP